MNTGFILIHRKLLGWEWYSDINTKVLFLHLLLKANHKPQKWQGIEVIRGQLLTGRKVLAKETGLSEQQVRTCLEHLKSTSEITIKSTSRYSIITLNNYNQYQGEQPAKQPTGNQQVTTNNNDNNVKNILTEEEEEEEEEKKSDFKIFGKLDNVHLSSVQEQKLLTNYMIPKSKLDELIEELSIAIGKDKSLKFDGEQNHFALLISWWNHRRKFPEKFNEKFKNITNSKTLKEIQANGYDI